LDKTNQYSCKTTPRTYHKHNLTTYFINAKQHNKTHKPNQKFSNIFKRSDQEASNSISFLILHWSNTENKVLMLSMFLSFISVNYTLPSKSIDEQTIINIFHRFCVFVVESMIDLVQLILLAKQRDINPNLEHINWILKNLNVSHICSSNIVCRNSVDFIRNYFDWSFLKKLWSNWFIF